MPRCSAKAFFEDGYSIGWDAREDTGDDQRTATQFINDRVLEGVQGDQSVEVWIKDKLGAPVRSVYAFKLRGPIAGSILSVEDTTQKDPEAADGHEASPPGVPPAGVAFLKETALATEAAMRARGVIFGSAELTTCEGCEGVIACFSLPEGQPVVVHSNPVCDKFQSEDYRQEAVVGLMLALVQQGIAE